MRFAGLSDVGKMRSQNQDAFYIPMGMGPENLLLVADGMGGHRAGNTASTLARDAFLSFFHKNAASIESIPMDKYLIKSALNYANSDVLKLSERYKELAGMGTTFTTAVFDEDGDRVIIAHVGDSRAYRLREGKLTQLTADHSLVAELIKSGEITAKEAINHPRRNVITRAIGVFPDVDIDIYEEPFLQDDLLMICSDGLTSYVPIDAAETVLKSRLSLANKCQRLIDLANEKGGHDNITVVLAQHSAGRAKR